MNELSHVADLLDGTVYYRTTTLCPTCGRLLPGEVRATSAGVVMTRVCPEHGPCTGLVCSDVSWYEQLGRFDVPPVRPSWNRPRSVDGCPEDCGLCAAHRQIAGTAAIEISNICNARCPTCLADNRATFSMSVGEVERIVEQAVGEQGPLDVVTLSGGEPTVHPELFAILDALSQAPVGRVVVNTNGRRIASDDEFLARLSGYPDLYVCIHADGTGARALRGCDPATQRLALDRLCERGVNVVPLVLAASGVNDGELGGLVAELLTMSPQVKSVFVSLMSYVGSRGSAFPHDPLRRLTIPGALEAIAAGSGGALPEGSFMPLPMPNPLCAAIGYFLVDDEGALPLLPLAGIDHMLESVKNAHFAKPDGRFESFFREMIDRLYADAEPGADTAGALRRLRAFVERLFPPGAPLPPARRKQLAEAGVKTVYLMQFMDAWTFDSVRLSKCSCQHLLGDGVRIPSCGYYVYHRRFDRRFAG